MERHFFIFVPPEYLDEDAVEHEAVVDWALTHWNHPNVLVLTEDEVYQLDYHSQVLDIVNEENDSMLQWGEDDWVTERDRLARIQDRLRHYAQGIAPGRVQQIAHEVLRLADLAWHTNKYLYFNL